MTVNIPIQKVSAGRTILKAWLIAGTLDILSAFTHYYLKTGKNPLKVLNFVAGGIWGRDAFNGNAGVGIAGLGLHYMFALIWTLLFFLICPWLISILKSTFVTGLLYGIFVWSFMNFVVLPMSALPKAPFNFTNAMVAMLIIMFAIGLPISIIISKYYRDKIS